jgi:CDP-diacylglycerol--glycerol-3-phosphate 3-phosphatidyltransferase
VSWSAFNLANALTLGRLVLAPFFVAAYYLLDIRPIPGAAVHLVTALWVLYILMELTDVLDGLVARRQNLVTDIGKILDPFADVLCRLTYFVPLTLAGVMPLWFLMIVIYRELGSVFLRLLLYRSGLALGAGVAGKLKSWFYSLSAAIALFIYTAGKLESLSHLAESALPVLRVVATIVFAVAAVLAVWSISGYLGVYVRRRSGKQQQ